MKEREGEKEGKINRRVEGKFKVIRRDEEGAI